MSALVLSLSCEHTVAPPMSAFDLPDYSNIVEPAARWRAYSLNNYTIEQQRICFCKDLPQGFVKLTVRDNKIVAGIDLTNGRPVPMAALQYYQTVDSLFASIERMKALNPERLEIEYDSRYGFPRKISFDYSSGVADDELWIETQALQTFSDNAEPAVIFINAPPDSLQLDSFTLHGIVINGDKLTLDISHGGGCKQHSYVLFMSPSAFLKSFPAQANLYLQHKDNDDSCDALLRPKLGFDLRPIAELYQKLYQRRDPIQINVCAYFQGRSGEKLSANYKPQ
ncbi:MAG: DUF6174 domain-containing protein [bacterium]